MKKIMSTLSIVLVLLLGAAACADEADVVGENISKAADNFEIERRIVFINGITDEYLLTIEGKCAIFDEGNQLEVVCKIADDEYYKHFLGLSDNVTYLVEQTESADVDPFRYCVMFRPETIIPDIDLETSGDFERDG